MGWSPADEVAGRARLAALAAGAFSLLASLAYLLASVAPLYTASGLVEGEYSLLWHSLRYAHDGTPLAMPHSQYIRHASLAFATLSGLVAIASLSSILLALANRPVLASGLAYGSALSLAVLTGMLRGYIARAVGFDIGMLEPLRGETLVYETLAGLVEIRGVQLKATLVEKLVVSSPLPLALLIASLAASGYSSWLVLSRIWTAGLKTSWTSLALPPAVKALLLVSATLASVFTFYPGTLAVHPQPPPATLEPPPHAYTCTLLARTARGAIAYTDFETYPLPGWATSGGTWASVSGIAGAKGNVLRGADNDGGVGASSHYYYNTDLSAHASLWVAVKTRWVSGSYYGISMMNSARTRLYEISIYRTGTTTGTLDIWSFGVTATTWSRHARVTIPGYLDTAWYTIVVWYSVSGTTISIEALLYDASGRFVTRATATISHANVFPPAYIGVTVDGATAYFDEFAVSTADPRVVWFSGFQAGMRVEVWDNLGLLVNSTTALTPSFTLGVRADFVAGTGVDGRIVVSYPDASLCGELRVPTTDAIVGGDSYSLTTGGVYYWLGANRTSASVTLDISYRHAFTSTAVFLRVDAKRVLYARLVLESWTTRDTLHVNITLRGATETTPIVVRAGAPTTTSTSFVELKVGPDNYMIARGYYTTPEMQQISILRLSLEICTLPGGGGACVRYPVTLALQGYTG